MKRYVVATGTVTHAIKGREILKKRGIAAETERMKYGTENYGCGYGIVTGGNIEEIERILKKENVKIIKIIPLD
ncbi:MAG: DUF3343 domain-containing protein [Ruminococcaceae bacterium]|jgi:hypothetical protein|nr:DUF3343 domain-containing protein [Oscillospiraceae bacterium]